MTSMRLSFNRSAIGDLALRGDAVKNLVAEKTAAIEATLAAEIGTENVTSTVAGRTRARGYVRRLGPRSMRDEAVDGALARALRAGGSR